MQKTLLRPTLIAGSVAVVLAAGYARYGDYALVPKSELAQPAVQAQLQTPPQVATAGALPNFAAIVRCNGPAVVNISVSGTTRVNMADGPQLDPDDPFGEFFRRFQPQMPRGEVPTRGQGSGFVIRSNGLILTNAHVVDGAQEVTVKLIDRREYKARIVGVDKPTDVALLKIEADNLPTVPLGEPSGAGVGDWVVAIGSPFGFENSVTAGIISAKSRTLPEESYVPFIQTDVAVNPGNSGGPLFNLNGEVIGINSQIYSRTGGYQGLSFAIPIDVALKVEKQLLADGKVSRGRLGVGIQELNQSLAESFGLEKPDGALVDSVPNDGPAAKAGIKPGDVILGLNGQRIENSGQLPPLVADMKPGSEAKVEIWRNGRRENIAVQIGEMPETQQVAASGNGLAKGRLGLAVRPLSPDEQRAVEGGGVLVEAITGPAERAGIRPGDVVLALNGHPVANPGELRELADRADKHVALLVQRGGTRIFVPLDLG